MIVNKENEFFWKLIDKKLLIQNQYVNILIMFFFNLN